MYIYIYILCVYIYIYTHVHIHTCKGFSLSSPGQHAEHASRPLTRLLPCLCVGCLFVLCVLSPMRTGSTPGAHGASHRRTTNCTGEPGPSSPENSTERTDNFTQWGRTLHPKAEEVGPTREVILFAWMLRQGKPTPSAARCPNALRCKDWDPRVHSTLNRAYYV